MVALIMFYAIVAMVGKTMRTIALHKKSLAQVEYELLFRINSVLNIMNYTYFHYPKLFIII